MAIVEPALQSPGGTCRRAGYERREAQTKNDPADGTGGVNRVPFSLDAVLNSDDDKQALRRLFEVAARGGAEACALVAEAWQFGGDRSKLRRAIRHALEGRSLADLRGRQEILLVHAVSARAGELRVFEITKQGRLRRAGGGRSVAGALNRFLTRLPWAAGS